MADPFTLPFIAANCVWGAIKGLSGQAATAAASRLMASLREGQTPENHDVLAATHAAFVRSIQLMANACDLSGGEARDQFSAKALSKLARDRNFTTFRLGGGLLPKGEVNHHVRAIFEGADADPGVNATNAVIRQIEQGIGEPLSEAHRQLFLRGSPKHRSWAQAFELFFAQQVKENQPVFRIVAFDRLNELVAFADAHFKELASLAVITEGFRREARERFDRVDEDQKQVRESQAAQAGALERIERLLNRMQDLPIAERGEAAGIQPRAYRELARRISDAGDKAELAGRINNAAQMEEQALKELTRAVERIVALSEAAHSGTNLGYLVDRALLQIDERARRGEFDAAAKVAEDAFAEWQRREAERRNTERQTGLRLVQANIEQQMFRRDAERTAYWIERRLALESVSPAAPLERFQVEFNIWFERGRDRGLDFDLEVAAALSRRAIVRLGEATA